MDYTGCVSLAVDLFAMEEKDDFCTGKRCSYIYNSDVQCDYALL